MVFSNNLKKQVDLPVWEWMRSAPTVTAATGVMTTADDGLDRYIYYPLVLRSTGMTHGQISWIQLASLPITPATFGNFAYNKYGEPRGRVISCPSDISLQIPGFMGNQLVGKTIRIISGTGQGQERVISACSVPTKHDNGFITGFRLQHPRIFPIQQRNGSTTSGRDTSAG